MRMTTAQMSGLALSLVVGLTAAAPPVAAGSWPQRMVRVVVPVGAASATDSTARIFAARLAERWKQPVVVENRPGADGLIGVAAFVAAHDDHALLFAPAFPISVIPVVHEKLPYDPARDLVPIASAIDSFGSVAVPTLSKVTSLAELVARARSQPGKLNCHAASGVFPYLLAGFVKEQDLDMVSISYREQNLAVQDFGEGRIDLLLSTTASVLPLVQAGKARLLAVTNNKRSPTIPEVPTVTEAGYPELGFEGFQGFFGFRGMSIELRDRIAADIAAAADDPVLAARLAAIDQSPHATTPAEFLSMIESQRAKIADIVKRTSMKPAL
jgi:tripartite-type tricarboxylate transporter receptor subunit TctC